MAISNGKTAVIIYSWLDKMAISNGKTAVIIYSWLDKRGYF